MFHYVARSASGTLLFRTWAEGLRLFAMLQEAFPELLSLCVMPDHVHLLLPHAEGQRRLGAVMSGYARFRAARRGSGPTVAWQAAPTPERVEADKERRNIRYVHLNPCRKELAEDPLAWPLSTHREYVGLAEAPSALKAGHPERFHAYVSGDPSVDPAGTPLPEIGFRKFDFLAVRDAVSAVTRVPIDAPFPRRVRNLVIRTAAAHRLFEPGGVGTAGLAAALGLSQSQVQRVAAGTPSRNAPIRDAALAACVRVVGDPRFGPLVGGDLLRLPSWQRYRGRR